MMMSVGFVGLRVCLKCAKLSGPSKLYDVMLFAEIVSVMFIMNPVPSRAGVIDLIFFDAGHCLSC